jgi:hypothetical protein
MTFYLTIERMWTLPEPNASGAIFGPTPGIARNMQADVPEPRDVPEPNSQGGGNLNGSTNVANLLGQAGTAAQRIAVGRRPMNSGNYCGVV